MAAGHKEADIFAAMARADVLGMVKSYFCYQQGIGIRYLPRTDAVAAFLRLQSEALFTSSGGVDSDAGEAGSKRLIGTGETVEDLADIEDEVVACRACDLHKKRFYSVAGWGRKSIRLLIVGDWLIGDDGSTVEQGLFFGEEQDQMLKRMLTAINLPRTDVYITNVIKCVLPERTQPLADHVRCCLPHLHRQVSALAPEIICTMGMVAARAVLNQSRSLSQLRGRFHNYISTDGHPIPLLTTYHPSYLLRNPEMKQATWLDLQMLGKRMGLKKR